MLIREDRGYNHARETNVTNYKYEIYRRVRIMARERMCVIEKESEREG